MTIFIVYAGCHNDQQCIHDVSITSRCIDVDIEEIRTQTIVSMPVLDIQITIIII